MESLEISNLNTSSSSYTSITLLWSGYYYSVDIFISSDNGLSYSFYTHIDSGGTFTNTNISFTIPSSSSILSGNHTYFFYLLPYDLNGTPFSPSYSVSCITPLAPYNIIPIVSSSATEVTILFNEVDCITLNTSELGGDTILQYQAFIGNKNAIGTNSPLSITGLKSGNTYNLYIVATFIPHSGATYSSCTATSETITFTCTESIISIPLVESLSFHSINSDMSSNSITSDFFLLFSAYYDFIHIYDYSNNNYNSLLSTIYADPSGQFYHPDITFPISRFNKYPLSSYSYRIVPYSYSTGIGTPSSILIVMPPDAPSFTSFSSTKSAITINFNPPSILNIIGGGEPYSINNYSIFVYITSTGLLLKTVIGNNSPITIRQLTTKTSYKFRIQANFTTPINSSSLSISSSPISTL
jgi:hypothetical protein